MMTFKLLDYKHERGEYYKYNRVNTAACWLNNITACCFISLPGSLDQTGRPLSAGGPPLQVRGSAAAPPEGTGSS